MLTKKEKKQIKYADFMYWFATAFLSIISFLGMHIIPDWQLFSLWGVWVFMTAFYVLYSHIMHKRYLIRKKWKNERREKRKPYALNV